MVLVSFVCRLWRKHMDQGPQLSERSAPRPGEVHSDDICGHPVLDGPRGHGPVRTLQREGRHLELWYHGFGASHWERAICQVPRHEGARATHIAVSHTHTHTHTHAHTQQHTLHTTVSHTAHSTHTTHCTHITHCTHNTLHITLHTHCTNSTHNAHNNTIYLCTHTNTCMLYTSALHVRHILP